MAYRDGNLPLPVNDPERLARLEAQKNDGLGVYDDLKKWRNGIPDHEWAEAEAAWEAHLEELKADAQAPEQSSERFFIRTLQLNNDAPSDEARMALLERALEGQRVERFAVSHRASLATARAKAGDFAGASRWLAECDPRADHILADGAYRIGRGFVALQRGNAEAALTCFGESRREVPFPIAYRSLAGLYRARALQQLGRDGEADDEIAAVVSEVGVRGVESYIDKFPEAWSFWSRALFGPVVADRSFAAGFKLVAALFWLALAMGGVVALSYAEPPFAVDEDTMGVWIAVPLLVGLAGFQFVRSRTLRRIAKNGYVAVGEVTGKVRTAWKSGSSNLYRLYVEAQVPGTDEGVAGESYELFGWKKTDELQGAKIWVLWHPDHPGRASVVPYDEASIR
jgi:hypothetical protein